MGTITKLNNVLCANISKVDGIEKANMLKWDDNTFCPGGSPTPTPTPTSTPVTPTPTPTITPTPTATPGPCDLDCCPIELCYSVRDCTDACACNNPEIFYIHKCAGEACDLPFAFGIYKDELCTNVADSGYYSQSGSKCYEWDGTTLVDNGPC
jgi:hypothetical protein